MPHSITADARVSRRVGGGAGLLRMGTIADTVHVVVATRGRAREVGHLLGNLGAQEVVPAVVVVVGASAADIAVDSSCVPPGLNVVFRVAASPGLTSQRNDAVRYLQASRDLDCRTTVVFFDDDFRPDARWILECEELFSRDEDIVGLTGNVLADGIHGVSISEDEARAINAAGVQVGSHWACGTTRETLSVYGCNMAFRGSVFQSCSFDEGLPLYAWQEDRDLTGQARRLGRVLYYDPCKGVHLGVSGARTSGVRLGYSQIANLVYLCKKGTVEARTASRFIVTSLLSNIYHSVFPKAKFDHRGRLRGNLLAIVDCALGRSNPGKILQLG